MVYVSKLTGLPSYDECGCCGHLHAVGYTGDCRSDADRFTADALDALHGVDGWQENTLDDQEAESGHPF